MADMHKLLDGIITENMPIGRQIELLQSRIDAATKPCGEVMMITPLMAKHFTTDNHFMRNRQLRNEKIAHYCQNMREAGGWALTGQPIIFELGKGNGGEGRMLDGYHRCRACVISRKPFVTMVVFGITAAAFKLIDSGTVRTSGDVFRIADIPNPSITANAVRWIKIYSGGDRYARGMRWENAQAITYHDHEVDRDLLQRLIPEARRIAKASGRLLPKPQVAAFLYMLASNPRQRTVLARFIDQFAERRGVGEVALRFLDKRLSNGVRIHENMRTVVLDAARDALLHHEPLTERAIRRALEECDSRMDD